RPTGAGDGRLPRTVLLQRFGAGCCPYCKPATDRADGIDQRPLAAEEAGKSCREGACWTGAGAGCLAIGAGTGYVFGGCPGAGVGG
ncbi:unnamed protein product, partial [Amoebophrya sp. A120]